MLPCLYFCFVYFVFFSSFVLPQLFLSLSQMKIRKVLCVSPFSPNFFFSTIDCFRLRVFALFFPSFYMNYSSLISWIFSLFSLFRPLRPYVRARVFSCPPSVLYVDAGDIHVCVIAINAFLCVCMKKCIAIYIRPTYMRATKQKKTQTLLRFIIQRISSLDRTLARSCFTGCAPPKSPRRDQLSPNQ